MLLEFRVKNHKSIRDEQAISFAVPGRRRPLPVLGVFGANASGKSNLLSALAFFVEAVVDSYRFWPATGSIPRKPFAFEQGGRKPSTFEAQFRMGLKTYEYGFTLNSKRILSEWLFVLEGEGRREIFTRSRHEIDIGDSAAVGEYEHLVNEFTRENCLFLSVSAQLNIPLFRRIFDYFSGYQFWGVSHVPFRASSPGEQDGAGIASSHERLGPRRKSTIPPRLRLQAVSELLRSADTGILELRVEGEKGKERIMVRHSSRRDTDAWLPLDEQSMGTRILFGMAPRLLEVMWNGGVLVVDELDSSLHPALSAGVVSLVKRYGSVSRSQLLFSSHDSTLLAHDGDGVLDVDSVWVCSKDEDGASQLAPLSDFDIADQKNVMTGYLQGRFGGVPFLSEFGRSLDLRALKVRK